MSADPKPAKRIINQRAGLEKVHRERVCRVTGKTWRLTRFHLVGRDLGGDDVDDNIIPVHGPTHMSWEHDPDGKRIWGPRIWKVLTPQEKTYVLTKKGEDYVRSYYGVEL